MNFTKIQNERVKECYYRMKHPSGLTVVVYPKKDFKSTYACVGTKFGSINSKFKYKGQEMMVPDGTAHYLEHKLFESEDGDAFTKYAKTGASANAYTSFDMTCYLFSCTDRFRESLEILLDLVQSPYFTPETVAKEQGIIGQEIKMYEDSADWKVMMNLLQGMYCQHPINIDIAGTVETIANITPEILYSCYNSYYNLNNMVLCVAGNIVPEEVLKVIDGKLKVNEAFDTENIFPEEPYEVVTHYTEQRLAVSVPMFELGFKEKAPQSFAGSKELICTNIILEAFAGESSALYRELLDKKLINSSFGTEYMEGMGYRGVIFSGEARKPEDIAQIIRERAAQLHQSGVSAEDFETARRNIYGKLISGFDHPSSIASEIINGEFTGRTLFESVEAVATVTLDDVNERLKQQLDPENYCLSVIKGFED